MASCANCTASLLCFGRFLQLAIRGLLSMKDAAKSGESGYPHTHVHEAAPGDLVEGLEAAAGGSPAAAAGQAAESGLEPKMQVRRAGDSRRSTVCPVCDARHVQVCAAV